MATSLTSSLDFDNIDSKGTPMDLSEEPGTAGTTASVATASSGEPYRKKTQETVVGSTGTQPLASSKGGNATKKPASEDPLWQKLAVVGAIAAAGIAIVAGVKHVRAEKQEPEPETFGGKVKRKAEDVKHQGEKAADKVGDAAGDLKDKVSHPKATHAEHKDPFHIGHAGEEAGEKMEKAQKEAKEKIEAETKKADKAAAKPDSVGEQKRMTYGQDHHNVPKKALKDTSDGFLNYKQWWPWAKKDL